MTLRNCSHQECCPVRPDRNYSLRGWSLHGGYCIGPRRKRLAEKRPAASLSAAVEGAGVAAGMALLGFHHHSRPRKRQVRIQRIPGRVNGLFGLARFVLCVRAVKLTQNHTGIFPVSILEPLGSRMGVISCTVIRGNASTRCVDVRSLRNAYLV